jgi:hypothetical protein
MLDRKFVLENAELVKANCAHRGTPAEIDKFVELELLRKTKLSQAEEFNRQANATSAKIGAAAPAEREAIKEQGRKGEEIGHREGCAFKDLRGGCTDLATLCIPCSIVDDISTYLVIPREGFEYMCCASDVISFSLSTRLGTILSKEKVNIANMALSRTGGTNAFAVYQLDSAPSAATLARNALAAKCNYLGAIFLALLEGPQRGGGGGIASPRAVRLAAAASELRGRPWGQPFTARTGWTGQSWQRTSPVTAKWWLGRSMRG